LTRADGEVWRRSAAAALVALAALEILWELWLAPLRPGGSWLALKCIPLLLLCPSAFRGRRRAWQWALLLLPWYFAEGIVRAYTETGRHAVCAGAAALLSLAAVVAGLGYIRSLRGVG
jgi:uncharacterized membrane protein